MNANRFITALCLIIGLFALSGCRTSAPAARGGMSREPEVSVERVVDGLQEPVSLVFLSETQWLVAERRSGRIRWIENGRLRAEPFATLLVPSPAGYHEYGLLGLAVDPNYETNGYVYAFHTVGTGNRATGQRIVRFTVRDGAGADMTTIVDNLPAGASCCHNGGRITFGSDGMLYATLGDTQRQEQAQNYDSLPGKVLRYNPDGSIPEDNPFEQQKTGWAGSESGDPEQQQQPLGGVRTPVFAIGFRNPFGITINPADGELYLTDNGPDGRDEVNRVVAGENYGWSEVMGYSDDPRFRTPLWASGDTSIAPTGIAFYTGTEFPQFTGNLFFAAYNDGRLRRAVMSDPNSISSVEVVQAAGSNARLDVAMGPDGRLYFTGTDAVYRLQPGEG
jgi:glucose/arabinose dehydrogenase